MAEEFSIRLATIDDMEKVFELSNDNVVRANSINQEKIKWDDHIEWFKNRIQKKEDPFYIVETEKKEFIAQVRFDKKEEITISISITKFFRGKGYSSKIIKKCSEKTGFNNIVAFVKEENVASQKAFINAGFVLQEKKNNYRKYILKTIEDLC